ncbi:hypothetical protein NE237_014195 [Protea cynaroides]|uniref:Uncharacterized protein n=1 Tax=Protea cynaroides TaxID=273540 RepID=A0A9Q0JT71_9MAGN|nr:hypothetical protein NE237_014195 [Protea cynaroides]
MPSCYGFELSRCGVLRCQVYSVVPLSPGAESPRNAPRSSLLGHANVPRDAHYSGLLGHVEVPRCRGVFSCQVYSVMPICCGVNECSAIRSLQGNSLMGKITEVIGLMQALAVLDSNKNELVRPIPLILGNLNYTENWTIENPGYGYGQICTMGFMGICCINRITWSIKFGK